MLEEFVKLCAGEITQQEAAAALQRLKKLEAERPTTAQLGRGAAAGAIVAPVVTLLNKAVAGGTGKEFGKAIRAPTTRGRVLGMGKALLGGGRQLAAASAGSAAFGATLPEVRGYLDRKAEKEKLEQYLGISQRGRLRKAISEHTGL
jgi:hypothetical protein